MALVSMVVMAYLAAPTTHRPGWRWCGGECFDGGGASMDVWHRQAARRRGVAVARWGGGGGASMLVAVGRDDRMAIGRSLLTFGRRGRRMSCQQVTRLVRHPSVRSSTNLPDAKPRQRLAHTVRRAARDGTERRRCVHEAPGLLGGPRGLRETGGMIQEPRRGLSMGPQNGRLPETNGNAGEEKIGGSAPAAP